MNKTLMELSAMEAQELKFNYLKRLFLAGISSDNFSDTQKKITNGLDFYSVCLDWEKTYNKSPHSLLRAMAKETMMQYAPIVREYEPIINKWLAEGMPLDLGVLIG